MPKVTLTVAVIDIDTPLTPAGVTVEDDGMEFVNNGRTYLDILGGGAGALALTVDSPASCDHGAQHDIVVTPVAATRYLIGPFPASRFNDADGKVQITLAAGAEADTMEIQAISLP